MCTLCGTPHPSPTTQEAKEDTMETARDMTRDELITEIQRQAWRGNDLQARLYLAQEKLREAQAIIDAALADPVPFAGKG